MTSNHVPVLNTQILDPSMVIGVPSIDKEHYALVFQLNRLLNQPHALPESEAFADILSQIGEQIHEHFRSEESYFKSCGMPSNEVDDHVQAHNDILEQYGELNFDLMTGKALSPSDVLLMIKNWIVDHVATHDVRIRKYVAA